MYKWIALFTTFVWLSQIQTGRFALWKTGKVCVCCSARTRMNKKKRQTQGDDYDGWKWSNINLNLQLESWIFIAPAEWGTRKTNNCIAALKIRHSDKIVQLIMIKLDCCRCEHVSIGTKRKAMLLDTTLLRIENPYFLYGLSSCQTSGKLKTYTLIADPKSNNVTQTWSESIY